MHFYDKDISRVKAVLLLAHGNDHLKEKGNNPVRYSAKKYNKNPELAIKKLTKVYQNSAAWKASNVIQFYDTTTNQLIK